MEDADSVVFDEEGFEVLDEVAEDDDLPVDAPNSNNSDNEATEDKTTEPSEKSAPPKSILKNRDTKQENATTTKTAEKKSSPAADKDKPSSVSENKKEVGTNSQKKDSSTKEDAEGSAKIANDKENLGVKEEIDGTKHEEYEHLDMLGKNSSNNDSAKQYMTDEEVMHHLDDIENIVLDTPSFELKIEDSEEKDVSGSSVKEEVSDEANPEEGADPVPASKEVKQAPTDDGAVSSKSIGAESVAAEGNNTVIEGDWYQKKLESKVATVKERLSKLERVLEFSYPRYKNWLAQNKLLSGTSVCQLEMPMPCPLDKPHSNRWKFICNRKPVEESPEKNEEEENADKNISKSVPKVWWLTPNGVWGAETDNTSEYPSFVMRAVKIFEDFLQTTPAATAEPVTTDEAEKEVTEGTSNDNKDKSETTEASTSDDKEQANESGPQSWMWLLVRCNRVDELMLFATGKNIDRATMDRLKQVYESGPGKDCNVKSLYCKSIVNRTSTTTFLLGSEALDELVGGIKIQLAPKTYFWSNASGAESLGNAVADLLAPTTKTTVVEIGCGTGLIGLMLASKCHQVIGLDSPSEVEEAETTSELNGVKNASFVMGEPAEVMGTIAKVLSNCKAAAIVNTNTNIGRAIPVMTGLRQILSLRRLVMVTTLTKQSVRAILELARPAVNTLGNPFMPIRARVVDTLPIGPHFEVVILMERRQMHKLPVNWVPRNPIPLAAVPPKPEQPSAQSTVPTNVQNPNKMTRKEKQIAKALEKPPQEATQTVELAVEKVAEKVVPSPKKFKPAPNFNKKNQLAKGQQTRPQRNKFKGKRPHSPDRLPVPPKKFLNRFEKTVFKPWRAGKTSPDNRVRGNERTMFNKFEDPSRRRIQNRHRSPLMLGESPLKRKRSWSEESVVPGSSPMRDKKLLENKDQSDLRERLSSSRIEPDILEKVKKQQIMLDMAKQKLSGPSPTVDVATAKHLQNMLSMVLEQTNKLQSQLPRSVWDRIAPPENAPHIPPGIAAAPQNDPLLKGRYVQEMGTQDILITTANREFMGPNEHSPREGYDRYKNMPPQRGVASPSTRQDSPGCFQGPAAGRFHGPNADFPKEQGPENHWGRNKQQEKNRWNEPPGKKAMSPPRRPTSPPKHRLLPMRRSPPRRPLLSPSRRPLLSPPRRPSSPPRRYISPVRRNLSPPRRNMSPPRHQIAPAGRMISPSRRQMSPPRRQMSPLRRPVSPPRRQISPQRRQVSPSRRHMSPSRRGMSPPRRLMPSPRRQQSPPRHQLSPPRRIADEWDIPSRGAIEQNTWQRPAERLPEKRWHDDRQSSTLSNWEHPPSNDRYRKPINQDKWDIKDSSHDGPWVGGGGDVWNPKQPSAKPNKDHWAGSSENRWQNSSGGPGEDNWNIRGKESFTKPGSRDETRGDSGKARWEPIAPKDSWGQAEKEDWDDLPDDAKDPWGDDGNVGVKERWSKYDNANSGPSWSRDNQQGDSWNKPSDNWQGKSLPSNKPQWQMTSNQQMNEPRWMSPSDMPKKGPSTSGWQGSSATSNWQPQNFSGFQQQRPYGSGTFKDRR